MVTAAGQVKVLDFGLAKLVEATVVGKDGSARTLTIQTEDGAVVGTASYMSPEQARRQTGRLTVGHLQLRLGALRDGDGPAGISGRHEDLHFGGDHRARTGAAAIRIFPQNLKKVIIPLPAQGPRAALPAHGRCEGRAGGVEAGRSGAATFGPHVPRKVWRIAIPGPAGCRARRGRACTTARIKPSH